MHNQFRQKYKVMTLVCSLVVLPISLAVAADELDEIHLEIEQKYDVDHIDNATLKSILTNDDVVLFDVRETEEYAVSHIENAIQIDPKISLKKFLKLHEDKLNNKVVVFYCSVGVRSSKLLDKFNDELFQAGAEDTYNLEGGAFKWHNDNIELVDEGFSTRDIHPYNRYWGRLIVDKESIEYR